MNAYIEKENLRSIINQRNDVRYDECKRMLKRNLCLHFPFSKKEAFEDPLIGNWLIKELTSGTSSKEKPEWSSTDPDLNYELRREGMTLDKLCAIYLLNDDEPQPLSNAMLVGDYGHELDTLMKLFVIPEDAQYTKHIEVSRMKSWDVMKSYVTPCTDLLIVDRYILSKAYLYERNLYRLIKVFVSKTKSLKINIVMVVESGSIDTISLDDISEKIKSFVEGIVGEEPNVTFVLCKKRSGKVLFHDRCILTNYRYVGSGDSLNYFNKEGCLQTGGFDLSISSLAENPGFVQGFIQAEVLYRINEEVRNAVIIGDKKSGFISFSKK